MSGKVYIVGTPIGNLEDVTIRAINTLKSVDYIACEDTRHSAILLEHFGIHKPTFCYHKFNEKQASEKILNLLNDDKNIAIISDAGMPGISDPGFVIIDILKQHNLEYEVIPGPTAVITAVVGSGLCDGAFCFIGFLPEKNVDKDNLVEPYASIKATLVFYSASHNINDDLRYLYQKFGNKQIAVANELTKKFEKYLFMNLQDAVVENPKGEYVILIQNEPMATPLNDLTIQEHLNFYLNAGEDRMNAIKLVARDRNVKKNEIYNMLNRK